jgi:hypothetical protein
MYDGRSTAPRREPAYCPDVATPLTVRRRRDGYRSLAPKGSVVTGPYRVDYTAEGFPRHYPPTTASSLLEAVG